MKFLAQLGFLSVLFFAPSIYAEEASSAITVEQQAKELFMDKKRLKAVQLLLDQEASNDKLALKISERFFTDQAQQEFETAESQRLTNVAGSEMSYSKSLQMEPDNLLPRQGLLILYIRQGQCEQSTKQLTEIQKFYPKHPRASYFEALISRCQDKDHELIAAQEGLAEFYYDLVNLYFWDRGQSAQKVQEVSQKLIKAGETHPELHYYLWRSQQELANNKDEKSHTDSLKKYILKCKSAGEVERRKYKWDPYFCSHMKFAEKTLSELEKLSP